MKRFMNYTNVCMWASKGDMMNSRLIEQIGRFLVDAINETSMPSTLLTSSLTSIDFFLSQFIHSFDALKSEFHE